MNKPRPIFVGAKCEPSLKSALAQLARANDRSVSAEFRVAVREHLERAREAERN